MVTVTFATYTPFRIENAQRKGVKADAYGDLIVKMCINKANKKMLDKKTKKKTVFMTL